MNMTDAEAGVDRTDRDLDLAVELINTDWLLASPPDRLTDVGVYQRILRDAGEGALASQLSPGDLPALRALRADLKSVFATSTSDSAADALDRLLRDAAVPVRIASSDNTARWDWGAGQDGMAALRTRLLAALATHLVRHGTARIGICQASPCTCVYVDHSRARTRRFCCDQCNDRAASAAYRRRWGS
jgi:predicted RNA-binding Zn ribbon-like protein